MMERDAAQSPVRTRDAHFTPAEDLNKVAVVTASFDRVLLICRKRGRGQ